MDIFKNIKDFFVPPEEGDEQYEEMSRSRQYSGSGHSSERDSDYEGSRSYRAERFDSDEEKRSNKVVNIQATAQLQVVLVKPEVFTDAKQIADHLIAKKTVVLNLETASAENTDAAALIFICRKVCRGPVLLPRQPAGARFRALLLW